MAGSASIACELLSQCEAGFQATHLEMLCTRAREAKLLGSRRGEKIAGVLAGVREGMLPRGRAARPVFTPSCPPTWIGWGIVP